MSEDAIEITNIVGKYTNVIHHNFNQYISQANRNFEAGTITFQFNTSEDFPTQCSINGGVFVDF